jgi:hypothetical protein|tara:strand:+ start:5751 stop:6101 length:351 start_codon:yes stop_codon:yes gene_type:complete
MKQYPCIQCGVLVGSMAPPQNTWCEECFEAVSEGIDTPPSVTIEQENPFKGHPSHPFGNMPEGAPPGGFFEIIMGGPSAPACPNHPDGCPPYDPTKYNTCVPNNNKLPDIVELTFA